MKVRKATYTDKERVVEILAISFDQNVSVNFVIKNDARRKERIKDLMNYSFEIGMRYGSIYVSDDVNACCILFPSPFKKGFRAFLLDCKLALTVIGIRNIKKVMLREKLIKQNHPKTSFIHLWYIGVDPTFQGKGYGSSMLQAMLARYPKPVYLETSTVSNIPFYQKHGFHINKPLEMGYTLFCLNNNSTSPH